MAGEVPKFACQTRKFSIYRRPGYGNKLLPGGLYGNVRAATAAGYPTLAIDRLGPGASNHPPATQVTAMSEAFARHDVVGQLRAGKVGDVSFGKIVLVGHSYGSDIALRKAAAYADVSGIISTGWLTAGNSAGHLQVRKSYDSCAGQDAKFADAALPAPRGRPERRA